MVSSNEDLSSEQGLHVIVVDYMQLGFLCLCSSYYLARATYCLFILSIYSAPSSIAFVSVSAASSVPAFSSSASRAAASAAGS